ncbi:hypothetical protein T07_7081 [Trichinella nelsoni]|uniref:Uncharacterized protein n=1 Tax=Trichinella nelsoni TaxID=6336 RepID=A0A0V0RV74_9BILA|nr:hypothetical protein T07_7081 [Trichinella nelsoni]
MYFYRITLDSTRMKFKIFYKFWRHEVHVCSSEITILILETFKIVTKWKKTDLSIYFEIEDKNANYNNEKSIQ